MQSYVLKYKTYSFLGEPLLSTISALVVFYVHYTTHATYDFMSRPTGAALVVKCLAVHQLILKMAHPRFIVVMRVR